MLNHTEYFTRLQCEITTWLLCNEFFILAALLLSPNRASLSPLLLPAQAHLAAQGVRCGAGGLPRRPHLQPPAPLPCPQPTTAPFPTRQTPRPRAAARPQGGRVPVARATREAWARCRHRHGPQAAQGRRCRRRRLEAGGEELGGSAGGRRPGGGEGGTEGDPGQPLRGKGVVWRGSLPTPVPPPHQGAAAALPSAGWVPSWGWERVFFINCWTTGFDGGADTALTPALKMRGCNFPASVCAA